jgi:hypothetical protein
LGGITEQLKVLTDHLNYHSIRNDKLECRRFIKFSFKGTLSQEDHKTLMISSMTLIDKVTLNGFGLVRRKNVPK